MQRYAVLLDPHDTDLRPVALVTEHADEVRVHFAIECGLKSEYRAPYEVMEPDGTAVRYEPGEPEYFNSVINTLSRGFIVNELEPAERLETPQIVELYVEKVMVPRTRRQAAYSGAYTSRGYTAEQPIPAQSAVARAVDSQLARAA
jgi:hypothetical protein